MWAIFAILTYPCATRASYFRHSLTKHNPQKPCYELAFRDHLEPFAYPKNTETIGFPLYLLITNVIPSQWATLTP